MANNSHRTAIKRTTASAPLKALLMDRDLILGPVLDYGCGHGADVDELRRRGFVAIGYDPAHAPREPQGTFETIFCTYVLNVIEDGVERMAVLDRMAKLLKRGGRAYVTVRRDLTENGHTKQGTWQGHIVLSDPAHVVIYRPGEFVTYELSTSDLHQTMPRLMEPHR